MASSKFLQTTESTLYLIIVFVGDMFRTFFDFTFHPSKIEKHIEIGQNRDVMLVNNRYQGPLSYLFVFTLVCAVYGYWATKTTLASEILLNDKIFSPFINILDKVWHYVKDLNPSKLFIIVLPLVGISILYSLSLSLSCKILRIKPIFKVNLYISSYFFGSYLFLHGLLFSYTMAVGSILKSLSIDSLLIWVLIWHLFIIILILKICHSFFVLVKRKIAKNTILTLLLLILSTILFFALFIPIGLMIFPISAV